MRYRFLGRTGLKTSNIALGTGSFGMGWGYGAARDVAEVVYREYRAAGGNFIDTADFYQFTEAETLLGDLIAGERDEIVLATKFAMGATPTSGMQSTGNSRKTMIQSVEASLKRLKTDRVDLFWVHIPDAVTPMEEVARGFEDLARDGKILYAGLSNFPAWRVATAAMIAEFRGWLPISAIQIEYNLLERTVEREILPMAEGFGMGALGWSPLGGGILTGKYRRGETGRKQAKDIGTRDDTDPHNAAVLDEVIAVAEEIGATAGQVALAWVLARGVLPIIGARTPEQLADNLVAADLLLGREQLARLDAVSEVPLGTPYSYPANNRTRFANGDPERLEFPTSTAR